MYTLGLVDLIPYLPETLFYYRLQTSEQLDQHWNEIVAIPQEIIHWVKDNFRERLRLCVNNNDKHLTDVIFKTKFWKMASYVHLESKTTFFMIHFNLLLLTLQMWSFWSTLYV